MTRKRKAAAPAPKPSLTDEVVAYLRTLPSDELEELRAFVDRGEQPKSPARLRTTVGTFVLLTQVRRRAWHGVDAIERLRRFATVDAALDGKTLGDVIEEALRA